MTSIFNSICYGWTKYEMINYYEKIEGKRWLCKINLSKSVMRIKVSNNYWFFILTEKQICVDQTWRMTIYMVDWLSFVACQMSPGLGNN